MMDNIQNFNHCVDIPPSRHFGSYLLPVSFPGLLFVEPEDAGAIFLRKVGVSFYQTMHHRLPEDSPLVELCFPNCV
jgi:hypothetical protein